MGSNQLEISNLALNELGESPLTAVDEDNDSADSLALLYIPTYRDLLAKAPWRFATVKAPLSRKTAAPLNEWSYQFDLPVTPAFVRMVRVWPDQPFEIYENVVYANATELACDYVGQVSETLLPPYFVKLFAFELATRGCKAITGSESAKGTLQLETRLQFAAALAADAQQRPNSPILSSPFIDVRA